jgi:hypothetical protein
MDLLTGSVIIALQQFQFVLVSMLISRRTEEGIIDTRMEVSILPLSKTME